MKKIVYSILGLAAIAVMASCNKELESENNPRQDKNLVTYSFGAQIATKTVLDGKTPKFVEGDTLKICYITDSEKTPVDSLKGTIKGGRIVFDAPPGINAFYAVYPYSNTYSVNYDKVHSQFGVKLRQGYAKGTFADANGMVAYSTVDNAFFAFKNLTAIVKIQAPSFDVKGVRFCGVTATNIDGSNAKFTGVVPVIVENGKVSGFGNVTEEGEANMKTSPAVQAETGGYYYIPVNPVKINGLGIWFETESERPGTYNSKEYTFERGHIYTINNIEKKLYPTDWYVSPDDSGNFSEENTDNAISYATMREHLGRMAENIAYCYGYIGTTFHLAAGEYTGETLQISTSDYVNFTIEGAGAEQTKIKHGTSLTGTETTVVNYRNLSFDGVTGDPALTVTKGKCNIEGCTFKGCKTRAAQIGGKEATDENLQVNFKNCLFSANTAANSGNVIVPDSSTGGILGFNNCRFENNVATTGPASAIYTNTGKTAIFLNKCSFYSNKCTTGNNAYTIGANNAVTRFGMNCCSINAGSMKGKDSEDKEKNNSYPNGAAITLKGASVIVNSTVWTSGYFGKWGLVALGCATSTKQVNGASIINSVIRQTVTALGNYPAVFLNSNYYQNLKYCLHSGKDLHVYTVASVDDTKILADESTRVTYEDTYQVSAFNNPNAKQDKTVDGIKHYYYTWNYANTIGDSGFTKPTADQVRAAVAATGETSTGAADGIGGLFLSWLDEVDPNAFTKDLIGTDRPENGICPGSVEQAN